MHNVWAPKGPTAAGACDHIDALRIQLKNVQTMFSQLDRMWVINYNEIVSIFNLFKFSFQRSSLSFYQNEPSNCATTNAGSDGNKIFVQSGSKKSISVKVNTIAQLIVENPLICRFDFEDQSINASGRLLGDTVYCDETNFAPNESNVQANVKILWDGWKTLDNPENIQGK